MQHLVSFKNIQKTYDGFRPVVKDLNLDIKEGEFVTLLGPSGSGKTTSLMMLAGFETPTQGEIFLKDKPLHNLPPHKRDIGMVFQNYALFPHMTIEENLAFPLSVRKMNRIERAEKVRRALDMVRLEAFAKRYPAQLSGGQQQRVALARALVFEPKLVLMDEPLGALDKQLREHMQLEIKHLHKQLGLTVVYVTHDQSEALTMSDRVAVFNDGVIQQIDSPAAIYENPTKTFVAQFIGENNTLNGTVLAQDASHSSVRLKDGSVVQAITVTAAKPGESVTLCIRPERVLVSPAGSTPLTARIREYIYLGDHVRMITEIAGQPDFMIKLPATRMDPGWTVGSSISLAWAPEHIRALDVLAH
ncbi:MULTISPECIES: ABC transporter ATP-binding protein [unclassified Pseudomonas]|jgi:putative spermidine/putrescine transport system ATP-binding protein|uniref:ABC transporter ATP-binding protein n=1 Tax=unclassified Pseudomonas TaxID=196821 RepID=UPI0008CC46EB|nr:MULTISPECIES: ABC transporter ATP-binding protein [unclassified Pseudomonas]SEI48023.1 putative spermidine/putrescine transport system ATP-binding protein [Pseudomonas sp. NFR16]